MGRTAVTGTASFLGARLLRRLVEVRGADAVLAVDVAPPPATLEGVRHRMVDLTLPGADQRLVDAFKDEDVDVVVHTAFFTSPHRDSAYSHELESIGTLHLAAGAAASGVKHLVLRSFTALYGARGQNPSLLTEEHPLERREGGLAWVRDKIEAEQHATSYGKRYPGMKVTVLRLAPLLGPGVHNFYTRILSKRVVPVLLGYDPLVQFLHPEDAVEAFMLRPDPGRRWAVQHRAPGRSVAPHRAPSRGQGDGCGSAPGGLRRSRPPLVRRPGRGPGRLPGLRPLLLRRGG